MSEVVSGMLKHKLIEELSNEMEEVIYKYSGCVTLTEVIGAIEILKLQLIEDNTKND